MTKETAVICFRAAMMVFSKWLAEGTITDDEYSQIEAIIAQKYGLSFKSIYH